MKWDIYVWVVETALGRLFTWIFQSSSSQWMYHECINGFSGYISGYVLFNFNYFWRCKPTSEYYLRWLIQIETFLSYSFSFHFLFLFSHCCFSFLSRPLFYRIFTSLSLCLLLSLCRYDLVTDLFFYQKTVPRTHRRHCYWTKWTENWEKCTS